MKSSRMSPRTRLRTAPLTEDGRLPTIRMPSTVPFTWATETGPASTSGTLTSTWSTLPASTCPMNGKLSMCTSGSARSFSAFCTCCAARFSAYSTAHRSPSARNARTTANATTNFAVLRTIRRGLRAARECSFWSPVTVLSVPASAAVAAPAEPTTLISAPMAVAESVPLSAAVAVVLVSTPALEPVPLSVTAVSEVVALPVPAPESGPTVLPWADEASGSSPPWTDDSSGPWLSEAGAAWAARLAGTRALESAEGSLESIATMRPQPKHSNQVVHS